jgi:YtkA-like
MRYLVVLPALAAAIALATAGTAGAGGWATVGFDPLPDGTSAGGTWTPQITVLQHGQTPLGGLSPTVTIADDDSGATQSFTAAKTDELGVYTADVVFPTEGNWRVTIDSTFGDSRVTYGPVRIGNGPAGGTGTDFPVLPLLGIAGAIVLAGAAAFGLMRQRRLTPAG